MSSRPGAWRGRSGPADPDQRIGDEDREGVSAELRSHFTAGRLDVDEFSARLDEAWRATTGADLDRALRDLPRFPVASPARPESDARSLHRGVMHRIAWAHTRTFLVVMAILTAIWAMSGFEGFWPLWPLLFWGFFVFRHHRFAQRWDRHRERFALATTGRVRVLR